MIRGAWLGSALSLAVAGAAADAGAAPPGNVVISVDRLFGFSRVNTEREIGNNVTVESSVNSVSLLGAPGVAPGYSSPRLAFDYVLDGGVSLGFGFGYQSLSDADDDTSLSVWIVSPRIGYFFSASRSVALWPRGGITHRSASSDPGDDESSVTALTFEVPIVFLASGGVGLYVSPHLDLGVTGGDDNFDQTVTEFGLQFGANAFF